MARSDSPSLAARSGPRVLAAALACVTLALGAARAPAEVADPGCGTMRVALRDNTVVYALPHGFLAAQGDSVWLGPFPWREGEDFMLDRLRGTLRLLRSPAVGETLTVRACWLLAPPPLMLQLVPYRAAGAVAESLPPDTLAREGFAKRPATARDPGRAPGEASLSLSGNKTIAIDFGSQQDAALRQSLDLALNGKLAPGVELTGVLSDRNAPLTSGGTTEDLQSFDRVLLELKAPHADAALGDVPLSWTDGEFGRLERRLQGARGAWSRGPLTVTAAAATQQGAFQRLQRFGVEGQQGPYPLTDQDGNANVAVVSGSEIVTLDGVRLARGEGADYAIDYERGQVTFTNRHPITAESRMTIDYQVATTPYRRNLAAGGGAWQSGSLSLWTRVIQESDDRGRPLDLVLDPADRARLALAGDSTALAVGAGVTAGPGDYDSVRVQGRLAYAYAGPDSGQFNVAFARVPAGRGDYQDSTLVDGRVVFRYVGPGQGGFEIGRALPLPQAHSLWNVGATTRHGPLTLEAEGAVSRFDPNTFSAYDDQDNVGGAGRARLTMETRTRGALAGVVGMALEAREVEPRFTPFTPLATPFAEESWGLPLGADLDHQRRAELSTWFRPRVGGELTLGAGRMETASGYRALRRTASWLTDGFFATRALFEQSDGTQQGLAFDHGGRRHALMDLGLRGRWLAPRVTGQWDERTSPSDTGRVGERVREATAEMASGSSVAWHSSAQVGLRRDVQLGTLGDGPPSDSRSLRLSLDSPAAARALGVALLYQGRSVDSHGAATSTRTDLGSLRLRGERRGGATGTLDMEITSEGETRRVRQLTFVGQGRGSYDALGNLIVSGDYDMVEAVLPGFDKVARAATSAHLAAPFGRGETWRGSRVDFDFETDARRPGELRAGDPVIAPDAVLADAGLLHGSVLQRLSVDLLPSSPSAALFLRVERRVSADRTFENFAQFLDDRNASLRWRTQPGPRFGTELELKAQRQSADQSLAAGARYARTLDQGGGQLQGTWSAGARVRLVGALEASWIRPQGVDAISRLIRVGPDLGLSLGARGRLEAGARRSFLSGPTSIDLLPTQDPLGLARWDANARVDWRVHETTTFGTSFTLRDRAGRTALLTGRCELRAFF